MKWATDLHVLVEGGVVGAFPDEKALGEILLEECWYRNNNLLLNLLPRLCQSRPQQPGFENGVK